jgi:hypothetical protein
MWPDIETSLYLQAIDFEKNYTELTGYAKASTSVRKCDMNEKGTTNLFLCGKTSLMLLTTGQK